MLALSLPRMFVSDHVGWSELFRAPPSAARILLTRVLPFSALPPALCMYSVHAYPGVVLPAIAPSFQPLAMVLLGLTAIGLQLIVVALIAGQVRLLASAPPSALRQPRRARKMRISSTKREVCGSAIRSLTRA